MPDRVLVVEDDPTVAEVVIAYLRQDGHDVRYAADGRQAWQAARASLPDLVVLDLMLPGLDGLEVCRAIRSADPPLRHVPILMLTALGEEADRVLGLEVGADDYVTKPFSPREVVLRVRALLRRSGQPAPAARLVDGDLVIDPAARRVTCAGVELALTAREFDLLAFLVEHPGQAYSRAELLEQVWGWTFGDHSTVTVHVRRLREKIEENPATPRRLTTVWGVGYRWDGYERDASPDRLGQRAGAHGDAAEAAPHGTAIADAAEAAPHGTATSDAVRAAPEVGGAAT